MFGARDSSRDLRGTRPAVRAQTLRSYVDIYLREEIQAEALVRDVGGYARLLDLVAASLGASDQSERPVPGCRSQLRDCPKISRSSRGHTRGI